MDRIIRAAEESTEPGVLPKRQTDLVDLSIPDAVCIAASSAARAINANAIVAFSERGATARLISKQRPDAPIWPLLLLRPCGNKWRSIGRVRSFTMPQVEQTDTRIEEAEQRLKSAGLIKRGERIVILSGTRAAQPGGTNLVKLHEVG